MILRSARLGEDNLALRDRLLALFQGCSGLRKLRPSRPRRCRSTARPHGRPAIAAQRPGSPARPPRGEPAAQWAVWLDAIATGTLDQANDALAERRHFIRHRRSHSAMSSEDRSNAPQPHLTGHMLNGRRDLRPHSDPAAQPPHRKSRYRARAGHACNSIGEAGYTERRPSAQRQSRDV